MTFLHTGHIASRVSPCYYACLLMDANEIFTGRPRNFKWLHELLRPHCDVYVLPSVSIRPQNETLLVLEEILDHPPAVTGE